MPHATFRPLRALTHDFSQGHVGPPQNPGIVVRPFTENTAQWAAGFLFASAQDLARFAAAVMDGGRLDGVQVMPTEAVRLMTTGDARIPGDSSARYAYGLVVGERGSERIWSHGGSINGFDAMVTMFPDRRLAVVVLDNRSGAPLQGIVDLVAREAAGIAPPPAPAAPEPRVATRAERDALVGRYAQGRTVMEVAVEGDSLVLRRGPTTLPLRLVGDDRIRATPPTGAPMTIILVRGADGRVEYLSQGLRALARQP
jgi:CubicO group peptidase (beta-lactamase class C family)